MVEYEFHENISFVFFFHLIGYSCTRILSVLAQVQPGQPEPYDMPLIVMSVMVGYVLHHVMSLMMWYVLQLMMSVMMRYVCKLKMSVMMTYVFHLMMSVMMRYVPQLMQRNTTIQISLPDYSFDQYSHLVSMDFCAIRRIHGLPIVFKLVTLESFFFEFI